MGNTPDKVVAADTHVDQFITQAHDDWENQMKQVYTKYPTVTKTIILPAGVSLSDPRLKDGVVVAEKKYSLDKGQYPEWPQDEPFECDIDGRLLPPCFGQQQKNAHFAIYPNRYFPNHACGYCDLHEYAHRQGEVTTVIVDSNQSEVPLERQLTINGRKAGTVADLIPIKSES